MILQLFQFSPFAPLELWRLEVQSQGVSRAMLSLKAPGKNTSLPFSSFCFHRHIAFFLLCLCVCVSCVHVSKSLSYLSLDLGSTLTQYDLILTNYTSKDLIFKEGCILRFWVDMNFGGEVSLFNQYMFPFCSEGTFILSFLLLPSMQSILLRKHCILKLPPQWETVVIWLLPPRTFSRRLRANLFYKLECSISPTFHSQKMLFFSHEPHF